MKYKLSSNAPKTEKELIIKSNKISGIRITDFCKPFNEFFSEKTKKSSGYLGKILEIYLGTSGKNFPIPDFPNLNIELKSLPLNKNMLPKNIVKICSTSFFPLETNYSWETSIVKRKLEKVLWIPFQSDKSVPYHRRRILQPFLSNLKGYEKIIKEDYENIITLLFLGKLNLISPTLGKYLILKPISSNKNLTNFLNDKGELIKTNFVGFYINKKFLKKIIYENLHI